MMPSLNPFRVLYLGAALPAQSETFVYREVLGLRQRGLDVSIASVHAPGNSFGDDDVDALRSEVLEIYPPGRIRMIRDAACSLLHVRGWRALFCGLFDAITQPDVPLRKRPKVAWQCLAGMALAWRVRKKRVQHVHAHMAHVPTTIAMYSAMALGIPWSFTGHAADLFRDRCMLKAKLRRASQVMCISHWHRRFYQSVVAVPDEQLPLVRCAVDVTRWTKGTQPTLSILSVARLVPKKGLDVLVRSIAALRQRGLDVACTIVGDGPERQALTQLTRELKVQESVRLLGAQSNETVRQLMSTHGLFALPCRIDNLNDRDGIPVALMEAMACGAAVVSGDLPTIRELIEHDVNGVLVPPDDVTALTDALQGLLQDPARCRKYGEAARQTIEREFSLERNLDRLEAALRYDTNAAVNACSVQVHQTLDETRDVQQQLLPDQSMP